MGTFHLPKPAGQTCHFVDGILRLRFMPVPRTSSNWQLHFSEYSDYAILKYLSTPTLKMAQSIYELTVLAV